MAKLGVFAIMDTKVEAFMPPMYFVTRGQAQRAFGDMIAREEMLKDHPEDFNFFELGEFDSQSGKFTNLESGPQVLGNGVNLK